MTNAVGHQTLYEVIRQHMIFDEHWHARCTLPSDAAHTAICTRTRTHTVFQQGRVL